jgi:hypothetical protein
MRSPSTDELRQWCRSSTPRVSREQGLKVHTLLTAIGLDWIDDQGIRAATPVVRIGTMPAAA